MNLSDLFKIRSAWSTFKQNHPKFPLFLKTVRNHALTEGTIIEIQVTTSEGKTFKSNLKLQESDLQLMEDLKGLFS